MATLDKKVTFTISLSAILKIVAVGLAVAFLFFIRDIVIIVFVSLVLASAFDPWVDRMQKHKIPRFVGILLIYIIILCVLALSIYLIIPPIASEMNDLIKDFPASWQKFSPTLDSFRNFIDSKGLGNEIGNLLTSLQGSFGNFAGGLVGGVYTFIGGVFSTIMIIVLTFYFTVQDKFWKGGLISLVPAKRREYISDLIDRMQEKIGLWLRGQIILSVLMFLLSWAGLSLLGVKYALVIAVFAGIMEFIPFLGPFLSAVPAIFIALTQAPMLALFVLILYIVIQQLEHAVLIPGVMKRTVGMNPIVVIVALLVGAKVAGILGVLLAIPVTTAISVAFSDFIKFRNEKAAKNNI